MSVLGASPRFLLAGTSGQPGDANVSAIPSLGGGCRLFWSIRPDLLCSSFSGLDPQGQAEKTACRLGV